MLGTTEIIVICGVVVLLFGAGAIPKLARSIGKARKEFETGLKESTESEAETSKNSNDKASSS